MSDRAAAEALAALGWAFRLAGLALFCLVAVATGALGWTLAHPAAGDDAVVAMCGPCLLGLLAMSIDMMSDMALSRRLSRRNRLRAERAGPTI